MFVVLALRRKCCLWLHDGAAAVCVFDEYYCKKTSQKWSVVLISHSLVLTQLSLFQQPRKSGCEGTHATTVLIACVIGLSGKENRELCVVSTVPVRSHNTRRIYSFFSLERFLLLVVILLPCQVFNHLDGGLSERRLPVYHRNSAEELWMHARVLLALTFYCSPRRACFYSDLRNQTVTL